MEAMGQPPALKADPERPECHVMAKRGWINDPNGPIYHQGKYHIFYQHLPTSVEWDWGLVWGHAVSTDLVHWQHLPPALSPTPGLLDADGCFSGCCTIDADGIPTIMYTGVRLRSNQECGPLPPAECDLQLPFIESQLLARAVDPKDSKLQRWVKQEAPFLALPPPNLPLVGWRDPFVIQRGSPGGKDWIILMGAGLKNEGGTTLIYRARELTSTWEYSGLLCLGDPSQGSMWECPLLVQLQAAPSPRKAGVFGSAGGLLRQVSDSVAAGVDDETAEVAFGTHIFAHSSTELQWAVSNEAGPAQTVDENFEYFYCISPDAPTNPVLYWLGHYDPDTIKFRLGDAVGPYRLDLGDTIYAPNILEDENGRCILWAWVQERRGVGKYDFSGCMATPRVLLQRNNRLVQQPMPELRHLRTGASVSWPPTTLPAGVQVSLDGVSGLSLDLELVLRRGTSYVAGAVLQSWNSSSGCTAILYDWDNSMLEVVFEGLDPDTKQFSLSAPSARKVGGRLEPGGFDTISLRILLDHSLLEVFTGTGQSVTTRVYRGAPANGKDVGVDFLSFGGNAELLSMQCWEMGTIWKEPPASIQTKLADLSAVNGKFERLDIAAQRSTFRQSSTLLQHNDTQLVEMDVDEQPPPPPMPPQQPVLTI